MSKKNLVTLQTDSNGTYLQNQLRNLSLTLRKLHSPPISSLEENTFSENSTAWVE